MYESILVPTDGSDIAERAGRLAGSMANAFDASVHVISVNPPGTSGVGAEAIGVIEDALTSTGVETTTELIESSDPVHTAILSYADEAAVDAIVMGTHGRTGVSRFLLGSVAMQTLRESRIPVITVHEDTDVSFGLERILLPTDGSEGAEAAAEEAIDLARSTGSTLHVLHVTEQVEEGETTDAIDRVLELVDSADIEEVEAVTRAGRPHLEIAGYTSEQGIDCIVMGTHGKGGLQRYLLGSVTERTVRYSPVPVIAVKPVQETATVEFVDYAAIEEHGWSLDDDDLFENVRSADLPGETYGTVEVDRDEYILEAAEAAGYEWPFHCRAGACVNCAAVLVEGDVEMEQNRSLSEEEVDEQALRLTCVATPRSDSIQLVYNAKELDELRSRVM